MDRIEEHCTVRFKIHAARINAGDKINSNESNVKKKE
jgi:hypothetical protein